jgi:hypothetical protein
MDLVTVTCTRDKEEMILQSHSLNLFSTNIIKHWVIVEDDQTSIKEWYDLLNHFYTNNELILLKGHHTTITNGWLKQQLYKLTISQSIETDSYLVLDSLLCLIKPTNFLEWPIEHGNGEPVEDYHNNKIYFDRCWSTFIQEFTTSNQLPIPKKLYYPLVPFRMKTSLAQKIVLDNLEKKIEDYNTFSEFLIYAFYANKFDDPLTEEANIMAKIFWDNEEYPKDFKYILDSEFKFFGINRNKLKKNNDKFSLIQIINFLTKLGLNRELVKNYITKYQTNKNLSF